MSSVENNTNKLFTLGDLIASRTDDIMQKSQAPSYAHDVQSLFCSPPGLTFLSECLQSYKKKRTVTSHKGGPTALFCMSGPVTHVDDDNEEDTVLSSKYEINLMDTLSRVTEENSLDAISFTDAKKSARLAKVPNANNLTNNSKYESRFVKVDMAFTNGDFYCGSWKDNLPDGHGKYLWSDGCMFTGEWERGKKTGRGRLSWPSGATYEGNFFENYIHGKGTYAGVDGTTYRGNFSVNAKHGVGRMTYNNGDVYEGAWKQGMPDGPGRYTWANGNVYMGDWKSGVMLGNGILTWTTGDVYDGEWLDGLRHGRGVYCWSDRSFYVGSWSRGLKDGKGVFVPAGNVPLQALSEKSSALMNHQKRCELIDQLIAIGIIRKWSQASALDHDWFALKSSLKSRRGSPLEKLSYNIVNIEERCSSKNIGFDEGLTTEDSGEANPNHMPGDKIRGGEETLFYHEYDVYTPYFLEREYVQGLLISEIVKHPTCTLLQKNTKKRQRNQVKEVKRPGETIFKGHGSYGLMLNLQLGIRYTVGKMTREPEMEISSSDFGPQACVEMRFPKLGSKLTPCHESVDFTWKDYCPKVFRHLREMFKIDTADYMLSLCGNDALRELASPGKSGSVFLLSNDDRFMIKTLRKSEVKVLLGMLPSYYDHVQTYENTLITKFFGVHRVKPFGGRKVRFVVMGNMLCTDLHVHRRYDLKGSLQGRWTADNKIDENTTLKDLDLEYLFYLEPSWREALLKQIECDCKLLESQAIMDYSLLIGLHIRAPQNSPAFLPELSTIPAGGSSEMNSSHRGLVLVPRESGNEIITPGLHVRGSPLRAPAGGDGEVELLLGGTGRRLQIQLGVNMPARADPRLNEKGANREDEVLQEVHDVVLYVGIIDILQAYGVTKQIEHAFKSLHYDPLSISAVGPEVYAKRFQEFVSSIFPNKKNQPKNQTT